MSQLSKTEETVSKCVIATLVDSIPSGEKMAGSSHLTFNAELAEILEGYYPTKKDSFPEINCCNGGDQSVDLLETEADWDALHDLIQRELRMDHVEHNQVTPPCTFDNVDEEDPYRGMPVLSPIVREQRTEPLDNSNQISKIGSCCERIALDTCRRLFFGQEQDQNRN